MPRIAKVFIYSLLMFYFVPFANATVPHQISFQGRLTDQYGVIVRDSSYITTIRIYTDSTGGSLLWSESQSVTTRNGLFQTLLGAANPIPDSVFAGGSRYLGIQLGSNPEMPGRLPIKSEAYSYRAAFADSTAFSSAGTIIDYGSNTSGGTIRPTSQIKICYGTVYIPPGNRTTITGLPFTSATSYTVIVSRQTTFYVSQAMTTNILSGSAFEIYDFTEQSHASWIAIGY